MSQTAGSATRAEQASLPAIGRQAWPALGINMLSCLGSGLTMPFLIVYLHAVRGSACPGPGSSWPRSG